MADHAFVTLDVFTSVRFGGNPLAVLTDARGLTTAQMQAIAREFNYSETTFVLPPEDPAHDAEIRIFTPRTELPFAGHPNVGTGYVLAGQRGGDRFVFEELAGLVTVDVERDGHGRMTGTRIAAPQPLTMWMQLDPGMVAASAGLHAADMDCSAHLPLVASCGTPFVLARVTHGGLTRADADVAAFRAAAASHADLHDRYALLLYALDGPRIRTRMFAPLGGIPEDPATGSANVALAGLLLSLSGKTSGSYDIVQGVEMGRPSELRATATKGEDGIRTTVAGGCVLVSSGTISV